MEPCRTLPASHMPVLRNVSIPAGIVVFPLQELLLDQPVNVLLDATDLQRAATPRCLNRLRNQLRMTNALPRLEDAHNSSLGFVVTIGSNTLVRFLVLFLGLLELHRVDLDAVLRVCEGCIKGEGIGGVDVSALGVFGQGPDLCASQRLQGAIQLGRSYGLLA
jgi:hypothetical protein